MFAFKRIFTLVTNLSLLGFPFIAQGVSPVTTRLGELTADLYSYALTIVGLAVFIMFVVAGLAAMVPALQKKVGTPTDIIKDAIIGLIILVSAFVILNTINPDLVRSPTSVAPVGGGIGAPVGGNANNP